MMQNNVYAKSARFDTTTRALSEDELYRLAPSIFATTAHDRAMTMTRLILTTIGEAIGCLLVVTSISLIVIGFAS